MAIITSCLYRFIAGPSYTPEDALGRRRASLPYSLVYFKIRISGHSRFRRPDVRSLWRHHAQHPHAVTMAGPLALIDCNNLSRCDPAHIAAGGHDPVAALNIFVHRKMRSPE